MKVVTTTTKIVHEEKEVDVKYIILEVDLKDIWTKILDGKYRTIKEVQGVPENMDTITGVLRLQINIETGDLINWCAMTEGQLQKFLRQ